MLMIQNLPKKRLRTLFFFLTTLLLSLSLIGCSKPKPCPTKKDGPPKHIPRNLHKTPDAVPKVEPLSKYGNRFKKGSTNTYTALGKRYHVVSTSKGYRARGGCSWYGTQFHGRRTSSGEKYDMFAMTAAHPTLPLPSYVKVTNLENGNNVIVKLTDRGPFHKGRIIDVSYAAATKLGMIGKGTAHVEVESVDPRDHGGFVHKPKGIRSPFKQAPLKSDRLYAQNEADEPLSKKEAKNRAAKKEKVYLQLGDYSYRSRAETVVKQVERLSTLPTHVTTQGNLSSQRYLVKIGPFRDREEAIKLTQKLARAQLPPPVVITEFP